MRIDDAVMQTSEAWARLLQGQRNIGDFTGWKEHDSYQKSLERLMRDLRIEKQDSSSAKTMIGRDAQEIDDDVQCGKRETRRARR